MLQFPTYKSAPEDFSSEDLQMEIDLVMSMIPIYHARDGEAATELLKGNEHIFQMGTMDKVAEFMASLAFPKIYLDLVDALITLRALCWFLSSYGPMSSDECTDIFNTISDLAEMINLWSLRVNKFGLKDAAAIAFGRAVTKVATEIRALTRMYDSKGDTVVWNVKNFSLQLKTVAETMHIELGLPAVIWSQIQSDMLPSYP